MLRVHDCVVFDPVLTPREYEALSQFGLSAIGERRGHTVSQPTLFYMPHCCALLYAHVLAANTDSLAELAFIGNSFAALASSERGRVLAPVAPLFESWPLQQLPRGAADAFNDTYVTVLSAERWGALGEAGQRGVVAALLAAVGEADAAETVPDLIRSGSGRCLLALEGVCCTFAAITVVHTDSLIGGIGVERSSDFIRSRVP